jgi:Skp family chaperone for outer membrane proteins
VPPFHGTDEQLDEEISTIERVIQVRLRRYAREMAELDRDRRALAQERARRRAQAEVPSDATSEVVAAGSEDSRD